jgi:hypothetical protein
MTTGTMISSGKAPTLLPLSANRWRYRRRC